MRRRLLIAGIALALLLLGTYAAFLNYLDPFEEGIAWNFVRGELSLQKKGWNVTPPWVLVAAVDGQPMRVCVTTSGRGFSCKLVQFNPAAWREFVRVEGFRYYWWANRFSFNGGYDEEYRGVRDLLRGYAYDIRRYPFVTILRDYEDASSP